MSQKEESNFDKETKFCIKVSSTDSSENISDIPRISNKNTDKEYLYYTPMKKCKSSINIPSTPKKENKTCTYYGLVGKNLTIIFESM